MSLEGKILTAEFEKILKEYELNHIHSDVLEKNIILVIVSLSLITALAWDTALASLFRELFGGKQTLLEEMSYALVITIVVAVASVMLGRSLKRKKSKNLSGISRLIRRSERSAD